MCNNSRRYRPAVAAKMLFVVGVVMKLTEKIRRDWHYYAVALGLIFILNGVVGLLGFETKAGNPTPSGW
jgi:hypothetical protein